MLTDFTPNWAFFFFYFRYFTWYRDEIWIKLNLMTQDFHVDRCCAHWALFSIFVISFDRGIKLGSNWNSWPMSLMLTDFTPNWVLFLFSLFHMIEDKTWIKLKLMAYEFNVDRFYAQLGAFSFFVISHDRRMEHGWNWILWPSNLMLTDFTPNWALFRFSLFHILVTRHNKTGQLSVTKKNVIFLLSERTFY